jgi:hypothetical protein
MIKLIAIVIAVFSCYLALYFCLSKRKEENAVDIEDYRTPTKSIKKMLRFLIVTITSTAAAIFFLSRLGINVGGLFQRLLAFLPLIRGFLPF